MSIAALLITAAVSQPVEPAAFPRPVATNLLGNGGMEEWALGVPPAGGGPVPPELWYPMATTANLFGQAAIQFIQRPSDSQFGSGKYFVEVTASASGNFVAQSLETFAEFRGEVMTFSVDLSTPFPQATARVTIDDGVSSSETVETVSSGTTTRVTVRHKVSPGASHLQMRVHPLQTLWVDNAQLLPGPFSNSPYRPRANPEPGLMQVPLGGIGDWYRFHPGMPVPEGYAIADGSVIQDPASPFDGMATPDLRDRFVRGAADVASIGTSGGNATVNLSHSHSGTVNSQSGFWYIHGYIPPPPNLKAAKHDHKHSFTTNSALGNVNILPPYVGLLKIVRIK